MLGYRHVHHFGSSTSLKRLKVSSGILLLMPPLFAALIGFLAWGMLADDARALLTALCLLAAIPCLGLLLAIVGFSLRCPLCRGQLMRRATCSISPKARRTLGSLRLRIATGALFRGNFRCPYCGEHCSTTRARR